MERKFACACAGDGRRATACNRYAPPSNANLRSGCPTDRPGLLVKLPSRGGYRESTVRGVIATWAGG